ncbi:MAG: hypothetical protein RIF33_17870 [Cyclobacteriaceae bacterium]
MKASNIGLLVCIVVLSACDGLISSEDRLFPRANFVFRNIDGSDFFATNDDYDFDSLKLIEGTATTGAPPFEFCLVNGENIIVTDFPPQIIFDFGNGDRDTVVFENSEAFDKLASRGNSNETVRIIYNGLELEVWNFRNNSTLANSLKSSCEDSGQVIEWIDITKMAQPEEFGN